MKKTLLIIAAVLFLMQNQSLAETFQNEPDGFRGIKWGTDVKKIKEMVPLQAKSDDENYTYYRKLNENKRIGNAKLDDIVYRFWKNKLYEVIIVMKGQSNWQGLTDATFEKFGKGLKAATMNNTYGWFGDVCTINLEYNEYSEQGTLKFFSKELGDQIEEFENQKAKEGATKGF